MHPGPLLLATLLFKLAIDHACDAYPSRYVQSFASTCEDHPQRGYMKHAYSSEEDREIKISLQQGNQEVTKVCPGQSYNMQVSFPNERYALATTTLGVLAASTDKCPNRIVWDPDLQYGSGLENPSSSYATQLSVPCAAKGPSGTVVVTSAARASDSYHHVTRNYVVDISCQIPACSAPSKPPQLSMQNEPTLFTTPSTCPPPYEGGPQCERSLWGYTCSSQLNTDGLRVHWTVGGCFPDNFCTSGQVLRMPTAPLQNSSTYLHMLLEAPSTGFTALAFAARSGKMHDADAVIGWMSPIGLGSINTYHITGYQVPLSASSHMANQWVAGVGVLALNYGPQRNNTILCFSRPLESPNSRVLPHIGANDILNMNWAMGGPGADGLVQHSQAGSFTLNLRTGEVAVVDLRRWARVHGNLMVAAWGALLPMGIFVSRHKWLLGDTKFGQTALWFQLHRLLQVVGALVFLSGIIIAFAQFENVSNRGKGKAHMGLGVMVLVLTSLQILGALPRPHPGTPRRPLWNKFHHWLGRSTMLLAAINLFVGISLFHDTFPGAPFAHWLGPVLAFFAVLLLADIALSIYRRRHASSGADATAAWGGYRGSTMVQFSSASYQRAPGAATMDLDLTPLSSKRSQSRTSSPASHSPLITAHQVVGLRSPFANPAQSEEFTNVLHGP